MYMYVSVTVHLRDFTCTLELAYLCEYVDKRYLYLGMQSITMNVDFVRYILRKVEMHYAKYTSTL